MEVDVPDDALLDVLYRALTDEKFFNVLVKDVGGALKEAKISLSDSDIARLKRALQAPTTVRLDLSAFLREAHKHKTIGFFRWVGFSWVGPHDKD
jgi:hypothetical protein